MDIDQLLIKEIKIRRRHNTKVNDLTKELETVTDELEYAEFNKSQQISDARDLYIDSEYERIKASHIDEQEELEADIAYVKNELSSGGVEESEELKEARQTQEYLNIAAMKIESFHAVLQDASSTYLIDLAYNEKSMSLSKFRKSYKSIDSRVDKIKSYNKNSKIPFSWEDKFRKRFGNANLSLYVLPILISPAIFITIPISLAAAVSRAKYLHSASQLYHSFMHALFQLKDKTDEEITSLLSSLIRLKSQSLERKLNRLQKDLETLFETVQSELDAVEYDETEFEESIASRISQLTLRKVSIAEQLAEEQESLELVTERINELLAQKSEQLSEERRAYMEPSEDRKVVLPNRLLYDYDDQSNKMFEFTPGLYLYRDRSDVDELLLSATFQLRNIMQWGLLQFKVMDLFGANFISAMQLDTSGKSKAQDINVFTLSEERQSTIELSHDILLRRRAQLFRSAINLGDYNLIQQQSDSAPMPYLLLYYITNEKFGLDERMKQLCYGGSELGINMFVFMKEELMDLSLIISVEDYYPKVVEVTSSGLTSYTTTEYRVRLEEAIEAERNRR